MAAMRSKYVRSAYRDDESGDSTAMPVGLAQNPAGVAFKCGTCEWFSGSVCQNENPAIHGKKVDQGWCCNLYDNDEMKVIVRG